MAEKMNTENHFIALSKSQFLLGLQCPKALWLARHAKELAAPISSSARMLFDQGHAVGQLAWELFPDGRLILAEKEKIGKALELTRQAVKDGVPAIYEGAALYENVLIRADILVRAKGNSWELIEVKSATKAEDVLLWDAAIQRYVLEGAGFNICKVGILLINSQYVRQGSIDAQKLFMLQDVTKEIAARASQTAAHIKSFKEVAFSKEMPQIKIGRQCDNPHQCPFYGYCWKDIPEGSIYELTRLSAKKLESLQKQEILMLSDIPEGFDLSPSQKLQVQTAKTKRARIDRQAIKKLIASLRYPIYFLDFETLGPAIPLYDGMKPYQPLPFQASLHIQEHPGGEVSHIDYLGDGKSDPRPGLVQFLCENIGSAGSVIAYNKSFEGRCLSGLADAFPKEANRLIGINDRLWDLAEPFQCGFYAHPQFHGSWSIKAVLPVIAPELSYEDLTIGDGTAAQAAYFEMMKPDASAEKKARIAADLRKYCGRDTFGMVKILEFLSEI